MYPYFPEEQNPETIAILSEFPESRDCLYIHRNGFLRFSDSIDNERLKVLLAFQKENPEIYELLKAKKLSPEHITEADFKGHAKEPRFRDYTIAFSEIMNDFTEIVETVYMLHDAQTYLNDLPLPEKSFSSRYIRYHLSNHFNELFILLERMNSLLRTVQRLYRKDARFQEFNTHFRSMKYIPVDTFKGIRRKRNFHVHEKRYTDAGLEELEAIEFDICFEISDPQVIKPLYLEKIEKYHKHVIEMVQGINNTIYEMLNLFFAILGRFLFSEEGNFIPPKESHKRR